MGRTNLQLVNFNKGLITEANPLIQPLGSTRDEQNFTLENDGKRNRRLGMGYEAGGIEVPVDTGENAIEELGTNTFRWDLTGDFPGLYMVVVQIGNTIDFFESTEAALSDSKLGTLVLGSGDPLTSHSITQVNTLLVVATGKAIYSVEYKDNGVFDLEEIELEVRDFFGVEDWAPTVGKYIDRGNSISHRPTTFRPSHLYNIINQGWPQEESWSHSAETGNGTRKEKRNVIAFCEQINGFLPSNADVYSEYVVSATDTTPRAIKAFTPEMMFEGEQRNYESSKGKAIIPLLKRGEGRTDFLADGFYALAFQEDATPDSASVVAEFAGRVFYAGFSGQVSGGDDKSPKLNNHVVFSQLVEYRQQTSQCYQVADPTSAEDSEIVPTDGGVIRISEATNIVGLLPVSNSLLVFAENGVWQVLGGSDFGFSAENYQVIKVTERGCVSPSSIVNIGEQVMYWTSDGIYLIQGSPEGFFSAQDLILNSIKTFYSEIPDKSKGVGAYDDFNNTVRWVYGGGNELVYKLNFKAWTVNVVEDTNIKIRSLVEASPFVGGMSIEDVFVDGEVVVSDGETVVVSTGIKISNPTEVKYLVIRPDNSTYTFSAYNNMDFIDWEVNGFASDASAYMQGAHFTGGSGSKAKQSPYVTFHFKKTEDGFNSEFEPLNQSSCLVQASWDWSNHSNSGKQGREFQAYKFRRHYMPSGQFDEFDNGFETVVTKNKVRGRGKALSVTIRTSPLKDCQLIGWEQEVTVEDV